MPGVVVKAGCGTGLMEAIELRRGEGMVGGTQSHGELSKGREGGKQLRGGGTRTRIEKASEKWGLERGLGLGTDLGLTGEGAGMGDDQDSRRATSGRRGLIRWDGAPVRLVGRCVDDDRDRVRDG